MSCTPHHGPQRSNPDGGGSCVPPNPGWQCCHPRPLSLPEHHPQGSVHHDWDSALCLWPSLRADNGETHQAILQGSGGRADGSCGHRLLLCFWGPLGPAFSMGPHHPQASPFSVPVTPEFLCRPLDWCGLTVRTLVTLAGTLLPPRSLSSPSWLTRSPYHSDVHLQERSLFPSSLIT